MYEMLKGKKILIVDGSVIASAELQAALYQEGAQPFLAHNVSHAFELVKRIKLDGVIVDHGLHNEAFDLCTELQMADIPYVSCKAPHRLQGWNARKRDAEHAAWKLAHVLSRVDEIEAEIIPAEDHPLNCIANNTVAGERRRRRPRSTSAPGHRRGVERPAWSGLPANRM